MAGQCVRFRPAHGLEVMMSVHTLTGIRVLEFTHAVLGPACGLIRADMGAEVIRVEPVDGDPTRTLKGFGAGYYDSLLETRLPDGAIARLPRLPLVLGNASAELERHPPRPGEHSREVLKSAGLSEHTIQELIEHGIVAG